MQRIRFTLALLIALLTSSIGFAAIDMQAHVASDEGKAAYTDYITEQNAYYTGNYTPSALFEASGNTLFGLLNTLMGNTCRLSSSSFSYGTLRNKYVSVDRDLNKPGYIIGYYDGKSFEGKWDSGNTWNREHTWPQSKGANTGAPMGYDMQSVRPTNKSVNSDRGNTPYGEDTKYYNPDDVTISNPDYKKINMGTYRGDAARVILYDYLVYGEAGGHKNTLYNDGKAQLLSKLGVDGVFESIHVLLKWHMQDPPSLTEMVRNDGAQDYQGNRNPMIDYPELAIEIFADYNRITRYEVAYHAVETIAPRYKHTLSDGFVTYLTKADGSHPASVSVTGAQANYDAQLGRLIISKVTGKVTIATTTTADWTVDYSMPVQIYDLMGRYVGKAASADEATRSLSAGLYIFVQSGLAQKVVVK